MKVRRSFPNGAVCPKSGAHARSPHTIGTLTRVAFILSMCRAPTEPSLRLSRASKIDSDIDHIDHKGQRSLTKTVNYLGAESADASRVSNIVGTQKRRSSEERLDMPFAVSPSAAKAMEKQGVSFAVKSSMSSDAPKNACCVIM